MECKLLKMCMKKEVFRIEYYKMKVKVYIHLILKLHSRLIKIKIEVQRKWKWTFKDSSWQMICCFFNFTCILFFWML